MMGELILALAMISDAAEIVERELVLNLCVEKVFPRWEWEQQVRAEARKQGINRPQVIAHFVAGGDWHKREVGYLRQKFLSQFSHEDRVWYITGQGKQIGVWGPIHVARLVRCIGQALPEAMKKYEYDTRPQETVGMKGDAK